MEKEKSKNWNSKLNNDEQPKKLEFDKIWLLVIGEQNKQEPKPASQ